MSFDFLVFSRYASNSALIAEPESATSSDAKAESTATTMKVAPNNVSGRVV